MSQTTTNTTSTTSTTTRKSPEFKRLGRGTFGEVFMLCCDRATSGVAVVKRSDNKDMRQVLRELFALMCLRGHENILYSEEFRLDEKQACIYMEYGGTSLRRVIEDKKVPECTHPEFRRMVDDIVSGTKHMHERKLMHRDLKPANVLVAPSGKCKIIDFGLCKIILEEKGRCHTIGPGSAYYRAPEVMKSGYYTQSVDWFSLGVIILEMLRGKILGKHGDVDKALNRLEQKREVGDRAEKKENVENAGKNANTCDSRLVWSDWLCLVKGLVHSTPHHRRDVANAYIAKRNLGHDAIARAQFEEHQAAQQLVSISLLSAIYTAQPYFYTTMDHCNTLLCQICRHWILSEDVRRWSMHVLRWLLDIVRPCITMDFVFCICVSIFYVNCVLGTMDQHVELDELLHTFGLCERFGMDQPHVKHRAMNALSILGRHVANIFYHSVTQSKKRDLTATRLGLGLPTSVNQHTRMDDEADDGEHRRKRHRKKVDDPLMLTPPPS